MLSILCDCFPLCKNKCRNTCSFVPCIVAVIIKVGRVHVIYVCLFYTVFLETRRLVRFET